MIRKFFPLDKNYVLEQAQLKTRHPLLKELCRQAVMEWLKAHNPLGLDDGFSRQLAAGPPHGYARLEPFYELLSGIYRFRYGDNQLEFLWTGADHQDQYASDWSAAFRKWIGEFCRDVNFVQAVLDLTYFVTPTAKPDLSGARMEHFLLKHFNLRKSRTTGMVAARESA